MEDLEKLCDEVLQKTQEKGGRISAVYYQQLVKNDEKYFRQVKMKLLTLGLIENREDNKIRLTEKGLKTRGIKEAAKKHADWGKIGVMVSIIIFILGTIVSILLAVFY